VQFYKGYQRERRRFHKGAKKDSDIDFEDVKVSYYNGDEEMRKKIWKDILEVAYGV